MKNIQHILLAVVAFFALPNIADAQALTNSDIVKLTKLELPSSAIISKIKNSPTQFDVSVDALVNLKQEGVNGDVVSEMITASSREHSQSVTPSNYNDPLTMRREGFYYSDPHDSLHKIHPIDPMTSSGSRTHGTLAMAYSYGIAKAKIKTQLADEHSRRQLSYRKPKFYLYIDAKNSFTANDFILLRLTSRKGYRELKSGEFNVGGSHTGVAVDPDNRVEFTYEQLADHVYAIRTIEPLENGEYCFVYSGSSPSIELSGKFYDFGISR